MYSKDLDIECLFCGLVPDDMGVLLTCRECARTQTFSSKRLMAYPGGEYFIHQNSRLGSTQVTCGCGNTTFDTSKDDICVSCAKRYKDLYVRLVS